MAGKSIQVSRPEVLTTVKVDWTKRGGFKVSSIKAVDKLPKALGIDGASDSATVGLKVSPGGLVTVVGLDKVIRKPLGAASEGRCSL